MIEVTDIAEGWCNFTSPENVTDDLRALVGQERGVQFLTAINALPLAWEDLITNPKDIDDEFLDLMSHGLEHFSGKVIISPLAEAQKCHEVSERLVSQDPNLKRCIGFAVMDNDIISREWHLHSFCIDQAGNIVEPTPIEREIYYGVIVP
jgi:hypothetical protein